MFFNLVQKENRSTITSQDFAVSKNSFNDIFKVTEDALKDNNLEKSSSGLSALGSNCATVTVTPAFPDTTFPETVTIDFGTTNCTDSYGTNRRGVILATISGYYRTPGTVISVTIQDYYHNDNKVEGTKTITN